MDARTLTTFRAAARTLSFTQTAASLGYAQSSVTAQIKQLEEALGSLLFNRLGNRLELTESGLRFLGYAERILALAEEAKACLHEEAGHGSLRITAPESVCTYLLPPLLKAFRKAHPGVRLQFVPGSPRDYKRLVQEGVLDVAFILEAPFPSKSLAVEVLREERISILAPPEHPLTRLRSVKPKDLMGAPLLLTELGCSYRNQFERQLIAAGTYPGQRLEFQSIEAIKRCVEQGLGVAPLPAFAVVDEVEQGRLVALPWKEKGMRLSTHLVWNPQRQPSSATMAFLALSRRLLAGKR